MTKLLPTMRRKRRYEEAGGPEVLHEQDTLDVELEDALEDPSRVVRHRLPLGSERLKITANQSTAQRSGAPGGGTKESSDP